MVTTLSHDEEVRRGTRKVILACGTCTLLFLGVCAGFAYLLFQFPLTRSFISSGTVRSYEIADPEVADLVDAMASKDPKKGAEAWNLLSARYESRSEFIENLRPVFHDKRRIHFLIEEKRETVAGQPMRYFGADGRPISAAKGRPLARTIGEALRFDLWRYEGMPQQAYKGTFDDWWRNYRRDKEWLPLEVPPE
jgi:hypothetical protein